MMTSSNTPLQTHPSVTAGQQHDSASAVADSSSSQTHTHTSPFSAAALLNPAAEPVNNSTDRVADRGNAEQREQREPCPPVPEEAACQLGKARWKQSHMMAAVVEVAAAQSKS